MITQPTDVLEQFPIRKSKKQKQAFREEVQTYVTGLGYSYTEEKGSYGSRNMVIGDPRHAKYLVTAHYDTCAHLPYPNLITPCNFITFMLYQLAIVLLILVPAMAVGVTVGLLTQYSLYGEIAYLVFLFADMFLMMAGPANKSNANDNTSGVVSVLEIARTLPEDQRHKVCFVLFDLEEAGLFGSMSYRAKHKKVTNRQIVLNLDCVGDGDEIVLFPTGKLRKDKQKMAALDGICCQTGIKKISLRKKGFSFYPSDQANFPYGVGIAALHKTKRGLLYLGRIHTNRDTILEETNVDILREAVTTLICQ